MDATVFNKILEDGHLFISDNRPPIMEKEVLTEAETHLGCIPDWYQHHKEMLTTARLGVEDTTKRLRDAMKLLDETNRYVAKVG